MLNSKHYLNYEKVINEINGKIGINNIGGYRVAIYVRLSREDVDKDKVSSESIKNQIEFLLNYCRESGVYIIDIYADDGISRDYF